MLNKIWFGFIASAFLFALGKATFLGDLLVFERMLQAVFDMSKLTVELAIGLIGLLAFWLGVSRVAEQSGVIAKFAQVFTPLFSRLMPDVPRGHAATGHVSMNLAANVMGLDNAATPLGLKAMKSLQELNPKKDTASDSQILFLVLNTSSVTLFPITVFLYRAQQGAASPTDVFLPIILATSASTLAGLLAVSWFQKIRLFEKSMLLALSAVFAIFGAFIVWLMTMTAQQLETTSAVSANFLIMLFVVVVLAIGFIKKIEIYQEFVEGAKEGFSTAVTLIPYLLAMLVAIGLLRSSGLLEALLDGVRYLVVLVNGDERFVEALPTALLKPLSGSGARAMMVETMQQYGADSFAGRLASIMQGSTETTFYVLAVYFGSVGIKYVRHAVTCGLIADVAGLSAAVLVCYAFYG